MSIPRKTAAKKAASKKFAPAKKTAVKKAPAKKAAAKKAPSGGGHCFKGAGDLNPVRRTTKPRKPS